MGVLPAVAHAPPSPAVWSLQSFWSAAVGLSRTAWDWGRSIYAYRGARELERPRTSASSAPSALAEGRYQSGVGNVLELYDALLTDVNARFQLVQARLDLASARARLQHALGEDD